MEALAMKLATAATYLFALAAAIFLGRFELHTDDAGVVVFFILVITFVLGCLHPSHAWQWALLIGPAVPLSHVFFTSQSHAMTGARDLALLMAFVLVLGIAGSYSGVGVRKIISSMAGGAAA
jgi:hypothetical protein